MQCLPAQSAPRWRGTRWWCECREWMWPVLRASGWGDWGLMCSGHPSHCPRKSKPTGTCKYNNDYKVHQLLLSNFSNLLQVMVEGFYCQHGHIEIHNHKLRSNECLEACFLQIYCLKSVRIRAEHCHSHTTTHITTAFNWLHKIVKSHREHQFKFWMVTWIGTYQCPAIQRTNYLHWSNKLARG